MLVPWRVFKKLKPSPRKQCPLVVRNPHQSSTQKMTLFFLHGNKMLHSDVPTGLGENKVGIIVYKTCGMRRH